MLYVDDVIIVCGFNIIKCFIVSLIVDLDIKLLLLMCFYDCISVLILFVKIILLCISF